MKVITEDILRLTEPERCVIGKGFESVRFLLEKDGMGFSFHKTIIPAGGPYRWHYKNHFEACFCIDGVGELVNLENGHRFQILPGSLYVLDNNEDHTFEAEENTVLISIFNPPVTGDEIHGDDFSYEVNRSIKKLSLELVNKIQSFDNDYDAAEYMESFLIKKTLKKH